MYHQLTYRLERIRERSDEGFTLIELLVVLLIIGILLGIAIPTFLSVTKSASNTAAESNLQTALTAADAAYTQNNGSYTYSATGGLASALSGQDTGMTFVADPTASTGASSIAYLEPGTTPDGQNLVLAAASTGTNKCYAVADVKDDSSSLPAGSKLPGTAGTNVYYGYYTIGSGGTCTASAAWANIPGTGGAGTGAWQTGGFPT